MPTGCWGCVRLCVFRGGKGEKWALPVKRFDLAFQFGQHRIALPIQDAPGFFVSARIQAGAQYTGLQKSRMPTRAGYIAHVQ
ncbi:hypothetical protein GCM10011430_11350 [Oxalicibacterium solurbis]|uniref:Uncharacterized protein n=1 Tax=Oxalicibacterium solurbis TaxID=69280 RepID=A0A8J3AYR0_9BURK|nr:hypothetical protein GCM10011430_11350 [Oxalicibacterium solurbis]